ncbi:MAG TPA: DUF4193 family protein [Acidimicrobiales bacterium]|nr:DUF4193 family protein [Acidimicrobiales bacterium]
MRVIDHRDGRADEHFTEGEPDLEPPEELAVVEVDEEDLLEEDLDGGADLEVDLDEDTLQLSLDHLVHQGEDGDGDAVAPDGDGDFDLDVEDLEDIEESLDRILRDKLAGDEEPARPEDVRVLDGAGGSLDVEEVPGHDPDEFVCRSCFLVRHLSQRADAPGLLCRDCLDAERRPRRGTHRPRR